MKMTPDKVKIYKMLTIAGLFIAASASIYYFRLVLKTEIVYTHLFYVLIILAAMWAGWRFLLVVMLLAIQLMGTHLFVDAGFGGIMRDGIRSIMFLAVGLIVCVLSERLKRDKRLLENSANLIRADIIKRSSELLESNTRLSSEIAERRRADKEAAIFHKFASNAGQGFGMSDLKGNITYVNASLCAMFDEASPEDVLKKNIQDYYPKEWHARLLGEVLPEVLRSGQWKGESVIVSSKGRMTAVSENIFIINDESGRPQFFANIIADITEGKKVRDELERRMRDLERLNKLTVDRELRMEILERRIAELEERLKAR